MRRVRQARAHEHSVLALQNYPLLRQGVSEAALADPQAGLRQADHAATARRCAARGAAHGQGGGSVACSGGARRE